MNIGSLRSLGLTTFLITIPIGVIAALLATRNPTQSTEVFIQWIGIGLLSQCAMGIAMLIAYRACRGLSGSRLRIAVITSTLVAGAIRGLTVGVLTDLAGLVGTAELLVRTLSSAGIFALWLLAIGATLHANDRYKAELRELLRELLSTEVVTNARKSSILAASEADLEARIDMHVRAISTALEASAALGNPSASARVLRAGIEERIRPLSHQLWHASRTDQKPMKSTMRFLTRALRTPPPLAWVIPTLGLVFLANSIVWSADIFGLIVGLSYSATFIAVLLIGYRGRSSVTPTRTSVTLLATAIAPPLAVLAAAALVGFQPPDVSLAAMAIGGVIAVSIAITGRTALDDREAVLASLREGIDANLLTSEINAVQQRQFQSKAATHLHNTVQSRLTAAALHLEHAATVHDDALAQLSLDQARSVLANVRLRGEKQHDPRERLEEIITAWSGIADITLRFSEGLVNLNRWHIAVDAIEEAIANGIRHGGASAFEIVLESESEDLVVTVLDNGNEPAEASHHGLGHRWLTTLTAGRWDHTSNEYGSTLTLRLPAGS